MESWVRFRHEDQTQFGVVQSGVISVFRGDMFNDPTPTGASFELADVDLLTPTAPAKLIGLWNNFQERAVAENLSRPEHPLYFLKASNCYLPSGKLIRRPVGYPGPVVFEGELGVVIGKRCSQVTVSQAAQHVFGYTCVNDVTARAILKQDASFTQWTRAKSFDTFGAFGPVVTTGLSPRSLRVRTRINDELKQDYPVADMFFSPAEIVSRLSHDMTLEPGDVIACGTSLGAGPMENGDRVEIQIDGIGSLANVFVGA